MGHNLRDAYYHRNYYLLKKVAKLEHHRCIVNLQITPTWEKGVKKSYHTKGHKTDFQSGKESEQSFFDTWTGNVTHETPKKWKQKVKQENVNAENVLYMQYCLGISWKSGKWFLLEWGLKKKPTNVRVLLPAGSMSVTGGCITDV